MRTPREEPYDGLVEIAAALFDVPMAFMSLLDENTQWFKASIGLSACETSREVAFCAHAILSPRILIVEDATRDPRFRYNPLVIGAPFVRFYLGAPLVTSSGECVGTICVADTQPRLADLRRIRLLERLAKQAVRLLEMHRLMNDFGGFTPLPPDERELPACAA